MATDNLAKTVGIFLRRLGEKTTSVTSAGVVTPTPERFTSNVIILDYYYQAGLALYRMLEVLPFDKITKLSPTLLRIESISLTANAGTSSLAATEYGIIFEQALASIGSSDIPCKELAVDLYYEAVRLSAQSYNARRKPSSTKPVWTRIPSSTISNNKINFRVLAGSATVTTLKIMYLKSLPRLVFSSSSSSESDFDIWNSNLTDILAEAMVMLAAGDANDTSLEAFYAQKLNIKYQQFGFIRKQNNSAIEETK